VVEAGRGAILATSAVGMLVICNVHDGDGVVFVVKKISSMKVDINNG